MASTDSVPAIVDEMDELQTGDERLIDVAKRCIQKHLLWHKSDLPVCRLLSEASARQRTLPASAHHYANCSAPLMIHYFRVYLLQYRVSQNPPSE